MINAANIGLLAGFLYNIVLPLGLLIWWKKRTGADVWCFVAGALCFLLFAMGLEQVLHSVCLVSDNAVSRFLNASPVAYMLYASLAAGLFEETGRLFGFKILLKKHREKACAVAYGIGHGGIEALLVMGASYLVYFLASCGVPVGTGESAEAIVNAAKSIPLSTILIAMFERISAVMAHVGLSMLVFRAAREKGKFGLYLLAILLHALLDAPAGLYQTGVITSLWVIEGAAFVLGLAYLLLGKKMLDSYHDAEEPDVSPVPEET